MESIQEIIKDIDYAIGKFDWGKSFLDAKAIGILNNYKQRLLDVADVKSDMFFLEEILWQIVKSNDHVNDWSLQMITDWLREYIAKCPVSESEREDYINGRNENFFPSQDELFDYLGIEKPEVSNV